MYAGLADEVVPGEQGDQVIFDQNGDDLHPDDSMLISYSETEEEEDREE